MTRTRTGHLLGLTAIALVFSCGARTGFLDSDDADAALPPGQENGEAQDEAGMAGPPDTTVAVDDASAGATGPTGATPIDAATPPAVEDGAACMGAGGGGAFGNGNCDQSWAEVCGSTNYQVDCACPRGSCVCFGPTTHVISYSGCPSCPSTPPATGAGSFAEVFALCGFPYPD